MKNSLTFLQQTLIEAALKRNLVLEKNKFDTIIDAGIPTYYVDYKLLLTVYQHST